MIVPSRNISLDILRSRTLSGLGITPDMPCYDTTRPSWLPYWINDTTETACLRAAENSVPLTAAISQALDPSVIPNPTINPNITAPGLPSNYANTLPTGVIPDNSSGQTAIAAPYVATIPATPGSNPSFLCATFGIGCSSSSINWTPLIVGGVIVAAALFLLPMRKR